MPLQDGTGPVGAGPLTGGRQGRCGSAGARAGWRGGRGHRNVFYATGLSGWQRAAQVSTPVAHATGGSPEPFARLKATLADVLEHLQRAESVSRD